MRLSYSFTRSFFSENEKIVSYGLLQRRNVAKRKAYFEAHPVAITHLNATQITTSLGTHSVFIFRIARLDIITSLTDFLNDLVNIKFTLFTKHLPLR